MPSILIVDDESSILEVTRFAFEKQGWTVSVTQDPLVALEKLTQEDFDLLLTDLSMPEVSGMELLQKVHEVSPQTAVLMMTAYGSMKVAIDAMKEGAQDFIAKPFEIKQLMASATNIYERNKLKAQNRILKKALTQKNDQKQIIGTSSVIQDLQKRLQKVAPTDSSVLICGETGTGKELVAQKIHALSLRAEQAFIAINCSAIPENLLESELFGYRKGAFTGADSHKMGLFEACEGGTLFLDEIAEMPVGLQAKLLRVLSEKKFLPLGSTTEKQADVRIIAATHQDIEQKIKQGTFRQDLYYRINIVELTMPSLKDRKEDITALANFFLEKNKKEYGKQIKGFSKAAVSKLMQYDYPGNIRELEHIIEQAIIFEDQDQIQPESILSRPKLQSKVSTPSNLDLETALLVHEKQLIDQALEKTQGNKTQAAKHLGITFRSLRYRLQKLGYTIEDES